MKIIIEIDGDDAKEDAALLLKATKLLSVLDDVYNQARSVLKHGTPEMYERVLEDIKCAAGNEVC